MIHSLQILCLTAASTLILLAAPISSVSAASASSAESPPGNDNFITMSVQNMPLGEVLEKIEAATDLKFNIDEQWKDIPVSVTLDKTPLDKALKRILVNLNNVVVYDSNDQVKIVVFGKAAPGGASGRPAAQPSYEQPPPPPLPDENPSVSAESEPETSPAPEDAPETKPADQEQPTQDAAAEGEAETKTNGAESGAQNGQTTEGGVPQEGQPAGQQAE